MPSRSNSELPDARQVCGAARAIDPESARVRKLEGARDEAIASCVRRRVDSWRDPLLLQVFSQPAQCAKYPHFYGRDGDAACFRYLFVWPFSDACEGCSYSQSGRKACKRLSGLLTNFGGDRGI